MSSAFDETGEAKLSQQSDFERITALVTFEFQVEESMTEQGVPTYYLNQPQETKEAFLRLLSRLEEMKLIATLRRLDGKIVLKVFPKPPVKPSNALINWALLFATIITTFVTGYLLSPSGIDPIVGGATFMIAMLAVLGTHEMGHKIAANKKGVEATLPYFIPGPPPFGTFGAVIMQKSLPQNRDALFDIGADGPISGFIDATFVSFIGLMLLIPVPPPVDGTPIGMPILWTLLGRGLSYLGLMPSSPSGGALLLHPISFAGWVGILVTMLNLLPAAMLDGGHVVRATVGEKASLVLTGLSVLYLFFIRAWFMAIFVVFMSLYKHPGPLDDVSSLSNNKKLLAVALLAIFVLCLFLAPPFPE